MSRGRYPDCSRPARCGRLATASDIVLAIDLGRSKSVACVYSHLGAGGRSKMQAVGACMRKLVMIAYSVLKSRQPFDPEWASGIAT